MTFSFNCFFCILSQKIFILHSQITEDEIELDFHQFTSISCIPVLKYILDDMAENFLNYGSIKNFHIPNIFLSLGNHESVIRKSVEEYLINNEFTLPIESKSMGILLRRCDVKKWLLEKKVSRA